MILHADRNSFYASCEQIYRPDLRGKPVAILSNNDGVIIALNKEAKDCGIQRGAVGIFQSQFSFFSSCPVNYTCKVHSYKC